MCDRCDNPAWLANADQALQQLIGTNTDLGLQALREMSTQTDDQLLVFNIMLANYRQQSAGDPAALETFMGLLIGALMRLDREQRKVRAA